MTAAGWALVGLALALGPPSLAVRARMPGIRERTRHAAAQEPTNAGRGGRALPVPAVLAVLAILIAVVVAAAGVVLGLAAGVACATATGLGLRAVRARQQRREEQLLLAAVRLLVAELTAGADAATGFAAAADVAPHHRTELLAAARAGGSGDRPVFTDPALAMVGHAWQLAEVTGAPVAATLARVADDLAARIDQVRAVRVAASGAQASALMLAVLPVLGVLLGVAMQANPLQVLFTTPTGQVLCLLGVCLDCAGVLWTARLTGRALRR